MIRPMLLLFTLCALPAFSHAAEPWRAVFVTADGSRVDYMLDKRSFVTSTDKASAYRFEFSVPAEGTAATIRLLPVGENTSPSEDYDALVMTRSPDMIVLIMVNDGLSRGDKFEVYTLYPKLDIGFLSETSSFLGNPAMRALAPTKPQIPAASAKAFPLRRIDK